MAKLLRKIQKIFGENAPETDIGIIGSLAAANPDTSKDVEEIQSLGNYLNGWDDVSLGAYWPPLEDRNGLDYVITYQLAYLMQQGVPEWNSLTTYYTNSIVAVNGVLYLSKTDDNLNNPVTDNDFWTRKDGLEEKLNAYRRFTKYTSAISSANWSGFTIATFGSTVTYQAISFTGAPSSAMFSVDGKTWAPTSLSATSEIPNAITYGNDTAVIVFSEGSIQYSTNGLSWTEVLAPFNLNLSGVVYGNGRFVAVASTFGVIPETDTERIITSVDGVSWSKVSQGASDSETLNDVKFANGVFVALKENGSSNTAIYSTDGLTWQDATTSIDAISLFSVNKKFYAVSESSDTDTVWISEDGDNWTQEVLAITPPAGATLLSSIAYVNDIYAFVWSNKYVALTSDFSDWRTVIIDNAIVANTGSVFASANDEFILLDADGVGEAVYKSDFAGDSARW